MTFPWAGFGSFQFAPEELPIRDSDSGWRRSPRRDRSANLGSASDSIVTLALGSAERSWEQYLEPDRYSVLEALLGTTGTLTDWVSPVPDSRSAYLAAVEQVANVAVLCSDNRTRRKIRTKLTFLSQ